MRLFGRKQTLHHFKICFPVPVEKIQNCLKKLQHLNGENTSAVCISLNGHSESPESCQLLHQSLLNLRDANRLSVFTFLEDKATALTYFTATAGKTITANPYSLIGDIGTTQKSYRNIKKLLDLIGIKYTELGTKNDSTQLWNQFVEKSEREKEITKKWLEVVEKNMIDSVVQRRKIGKEEALALKNRLLHPRDALKAKLIDSIGTFEEFKALNYPNHQVEDLVYRLDGSRARSTLTHRELSALSTLVEVLEMPKVVMFSSEDILLGSLNEIFSLLEARLMSEVSLDELDLFLEDVFAAISRRVAQSQLMF